ncbi:MAG: DUF1015 family protein [Planctomycetes bacterium]|nr:DUF1015 family protein [Planctomycetota bacterium]
MSRVLPFRALRFRSYDDPEVRRRTAPSTEPLPGCHEAGRAPDDTVLALERADGAARILEALRGSGMFLESPTPAFHAYRQDYLVASGLEKSRLAFLGLLDPWSGDEMPVHAVCDTDARLVESFRTGILRGGIQAGLVAIGFEDPSFEIEKLIERGTARAGPARMVLPDETSRIWTIEDRGICAAITDAMARMQLYVLDGAHRYRALRRLRDEIAPDPDARMIPLCAFFNLHDYAVSLGAYHTLAALPPGFDLNRLVLELDPLFDVTIYRFSGALDKRRALAEVGEDLRVQGFAGSTIAAYIGGFEQFMLIQLRDGVDPAPLYLPDVPPALQGMDAVLLRKVIFPRAGIDAAGVGLARDPSAAVDAVDAGLYGAAFLINPPNKAKMVEAARAGFRLPLGSVRMDPAPRAGLILHKLREPLEVMAR